MIEENRKSTGNGYGLIILQTAMRKSLVLRSLCIVKDGWGTLLSGELQIWRTAVTRLNSARPQCILVYNALRFPYLDKENIIDMLELLYISLLYCCNTLAGCIQSTRADFSNLFPASQK